MLLPILINLSCLNLILGFVFLIYLTRPWFCGCPLPFLALLHSCKIPVFGSLLLFFCPFLLSLVSLSVRLTCSTLDDQSKIRSSTNIRSSSWYYNYFFIYVCMKIEDLPYKQYNTWQPLTFMCRQVSVCTCIWTMSEHWNITWCASSNSVPQVSSLCQNVLHMLQISFFMTCYKFCQLNPISCLSCLLLIKLKAFVDCSPFFILSRLFNW